MKTFLILFGVSFILAAIVAEIHERKNVAAPEKAAKPAPWTIVCDGAGHYSFIEKDGSTWVLPFDSRERAVRQMEYDRGVVEKRSVVTPEDRARAEIARTAKWTPCEEPPVTVVTAGPMIWENNRMGGMPPVEHVEATWALDGVLKATVTTYSFVRIGDWLNVKTKLNVEDNGVTFVGQHALAPENARILVTHEPVVTKTADGWEITFKP